MTDKKKKAINNVLSEEKNYVERMEDGMEAIEVLENWYQCLLDMGYELRSGSGCPKLVRLSDGNEIAMVHNVENYRVSVLPILSCL